MLDTKPRRDFDLCDAGHPLPIAGEDCKRCGATRHEMCKLYDELSPKEVRENKRAAMAGEQPPH